MNYRLWTRLALLIGILAGGMHAVRIYRVSHSYPVSLAVLLAAGLTVILGSIALIRPVPPRSAAKGTFLVTAGAILVLAAAVFEMSAGLARVAVLPLDEPRELGFAGVTLGSFTASYREDGKLLECRSDLLLDFGGRIDSLTVISGSPVAVCGVSIFQLGFSGVEERAGGSPYSRLGLLKEKARWPFRTGLALLDIGALFLLFTRRKSQEAIET